ncbi:Uncharacterised protein [Yersinia aldovae]|uniref:Uncharacterized protein n=1 Tax=Yersinia aldovae TaxID=29483 RepID=A0ABM9SWF2_YERAL|nr:Uncharacterised protein [Yersinia aldovae]
MVRQIAGGGERQLLFGVNFTVVLSIAVNSELPSTGGIERAAVKQVIGAQGHIPPGQQGAAATAIADTEHGELHIPPGFQFILVNQCASRVEHQIAPRR